MCEAMQIVMVRILVCYMYIYYCILQILFDDDSTEHCSITSKSALNSDKTCPANSINSPGPLTDRIIDLLNQNCECFSTVELTYETCTLEGKHLISDVRSRQG